MLRCTCTELSLRSSLAAKMVEALLAHWKQRNVVQVTVVGDGDQGAIAGKNYLGRG